MFLYFWNPFSCPAFQGFYLICDWLNLTKGFPGGSVVKNPPANAGDPGSGRSSGEGNGNPLQYSCLENSEEPGGLQSMGSQSQTRLSTHAGISSCIFTMGGCVLAFNHLPCYYSGMVLARGNKTGEFY